MNKDRREIIGYPTKEIAVVVKGALKTGGTWGYSDSTTVELAFETAKQILKEHGGEVVHFSTMHYHPTKRNPFTGEPELQFFRVASVKPERLCRRKEKERVHKSVKTMHGRAREFIS